MNNSLWFQYCKASLQKIVLPHKEILDMSVTMMFDDNVMVEQCVDFRLHKDHQSILLRILGFYSNVNIVLSKINIRCVETIPKVYKTNRIWRLTLMTKATRCPDSTHHVNDLCRILCDKKSILKRLQTKAKDQRSEIKATEKQLVKALQSTDSKTWSIETDDGTVTFTLESIVGCTKNSTFLAQQCNTTEDDQTDSLE